MKFKTKLKYKDGTTDYYHNGTAVENKIRAEILIVPGKALDIHVANVGKLPLMACAMHKNHPDHWFKATNTEEMKDKNIIFIRDEVYQIANRKEYQTLLEHEFGHIFHEHTGGVETVYDSDEILANAFMEEPEHMNSLVKKWTVHNHKFCKKCNITTVMDNNTIKNHWFLYCPKCGMWYGDGYLNMFYVEKIICERLGKKMKELPPNLQFLLDKPILTFEQNVVIEKTIAEAKRMKNI